MAKNIIDNVKVIPAPGTLSINNPVASKKNNMEMTSQVFLPDLDLMILVPMPSYFSVYSLLLNRLFCLTEIPSGESSNHF